MKHFLPSSLLQLERPLKEPAVHVNQLHVNAANDAEFTTSRSARSMTTKISEAKFEALKSKLRELFELDKSDLDFGIYRIMAAKNKEVTAFLDRHLRETVRGILESSGSDESAKLSAEIVKAREAAATAGFNPDDSPRVKELEEQYARLGGGSTEELEADIYNHLLNFFSRYYDEGDFISKRYYKGDTYALPYGGEEVTLHWANKDQYYIKSGEWHKDYRFRADGKTVHFRLVEATAEAGNNKEPDESKRRYILALENPVVWDEKSETLTLRFEFRTPLESDERRIDASEATRILEVITTRTPAGRKATSGRNIAQMLKFGR